MEELGLELELELELGLGLGLELGLEVRVLVLGLELGLELVRNHIYHLHNISFRYHKILSNVLIHQKGKYKCWYNKLRR